MAKGYLHTTMARVRKVPTPKASCPDCRGRSMAAHVHLEELWKPSAETFAIDGTRSANPDVYWQLTPKAAEKYRKALMESLEQKWHDEGYDPYEEAVFKDGRDHFSCVVLCRKRGREFAGKLLGEVTPERARTACLKNLEQWELSRVA